MYAEKVIAVGKQGQGQHDVGDWVNEAHSSSVLLTTGLKLSAADCACMRVCKTKAPVKSLYVCSSRYRRLLSPTLWYALIHSQKQNNSRERVYITAALASIPYLRCSCESQSAGTSLYLTWAAKSVPRACATHLYHIQRIYHQRRRYRSAASSYYAVPQCQLATGRCHPRVQRPAYHKTMALRRNSLICTPAFHQTSSLCVSSFLTGSHGCVIASRLSNSALQVELKRTSLAAPGLALSLRCASLLICRALVALSFVDCHPIPGPSASLLCNSAWLLILFLQASRPDPPVCDDTC